MQSQKSILLPFPTTHFQLKYVKTACLLDSFGFMIYLGSLNLQRRLLHTIFHSSENLDEIFE